MLVTHGPGTSQHNYTYSALDPGAILLNRGTIEATGLNGTGVWFNAHATKFDNAGTINAVGNDAIYISSGRTVGSINFVAQSKVFGDITNDGNTTKLTFGKGNIAGVAQDNTGDAGFRMDYAGNISANKFDIETWGGRTTLSAANLRFRNGSVGRGTVASTLNLPGTVLFTTLQLGSATNTTSTLDGKASGQVTVDSGVNNHIFVQNLAKLSVPFIINNNTIRDNTLVEATGNIPGNDVSIRNNTGATFRDNTTITAAAGLRNDGNFTDNKTITAGTFIDNSDIFNGNGTIEAKGTIAGLPMWTSIRNQNSGWFGNNRVIRSTFGILNEGIFWNNNTIDAGTYLENTASAGIWNTTNLWTGASLFNDGFIDNTMTMIIGWGPGCSVFNGITGEITRTMNMSVGDSVYNSGLIQDTGTMNVNGELVNFVDATIDKTLTMNVGTNVFNDGVIMNTMTATVQGNVENRTGGEILDTGTMTVAGRLINFELVDRALKIDVTGNIDNDGTIRNVLTLQTAADLNNYATGQVRNNTTVKALGMINNLGTIDTANLVEADGNIENSGTIRNVVTLHSGTDIVNWNTGWIIRNQTVSADRDVLNAGVINRFTTLRAGADIVNANTGYINVELASTATAGWNVYNSGLIRANGTIDVGNRFTNQTDGWITGAGQITTGVGLVNDGSISVGNTPAFGNGKAIDTLDVVGPYFNNPTGKIFVDIDPSHYPSQPFAGLHNDLIDVDGAGTVDGGEVFVNAPSNDKNINPTPARYVGNTKYTFLDTTAGLTVNTKMTATDPIDLLLFDFLADHDTQSYWLDVQREYYYGPYGDTYNQISVGNYIDEIGLDPDPLGDFFGVLVELDKLNKNAGIAHRAGISKAAKFSLDQMSGAIYGTLGTASVTNTTIVNNTLYDVLRRDAFGGGKLGCDPCEPICGPRAADNRNAWGLGFGTGGSTQFDGNAYGYEQTFGGTILGIDQKFKRQTRWGVFVSYGEGRISSDLIEKSKSKEFLGGLYFRKDMKVGYILASGGLGSNRYDTERTISFMNRKAKNKHDAIVGTFAVERGLEFKNRYGKLRPFLGLQYVANQQDGFTENGADSLNLVGDITTAHSFRSMLGTRFDLKPMTVNRGQLSLYGNAVWMHEFLSRTHTNFTAQFSNPGMSNFSSTAKYMVKGNTPNRDWAVLGLGLNYEKNRFRLFGGYDAYVNAQQVLHTGNAGLAYGW